MKEFLSAVPLTSLMSGCICAMQHPDGNKLGKKQENKLIAPTEQQLQAAKETFAKIGGIIPSESKENVPLFVVPGETQDVDLEKLSNLPFSFGLRLAFTKVTDGGLKEIAKMENLTILNLAYTKVTDTGC